MKNYWDKCPLCGGNALLEDDENETAPTVGAPVICENEECGNTGEIQYMSLNDDFCQWND